MSEINTTKEAAPTEPAPPSDNFLVAFHYTGEDNGMDREGFDSRVITAPKDFVIKSSKEIKDVAEAMAAALFQDGKKYAGLTISVLNVQRLPI